jgi:hypothetical protein
MEEPEEKRAQGSYRRRWDGNIETYLREILWGGMEWINLSQDRDQ